MPRTLTLQAPRTLAHAPIEERALRPGEIRLRALVSGISHGTELHLYHGVTPLHDRRFDERLRLFVPQESAGRSYPMELGYEMVSRVVEVGEAVDGFEVGDLVHSPTEHREETIYDTTVPLPIGYPALRLPPDLDLDTALFVALCSVSVVAAHDADIRLGDTVLVSGLGAVGLLTSQAARLSGATTVIGVDPIRRRREAAERLGATFTVDPGAVGDVARHVKERLGVGVDSCIETSGSDRALHACLRAARMAGRIVAAAIYPGGAPNLRLGEEWHVNQLTLLSSMNVWGCPNRDHPHWDRQRTAETALELLRTGRIRADGLVTHHFPFERAAEAYELIAEHPEETIKVALTY